MRAHDVEGASRGLGDWFRAEADADGDRPFIQCGGDWFTLGQIDLLSDQVAAGLQELGVDRGDRVAILLPNRIEYVVLVYACAKVGAVQVPLNTFLRGDFLRHQYAEPQASVVISDALGLQQTEPLLDALPDLRTFVLVGEPHEDNPFPANTVPYHQLESTNHALKRPNVSPSDLCMVLYTSGTTGPSKGCMVSHGYYAHIPRSFMEFGWFKPGDRIFGATPLFHASGQITLVANALAARGSAVVEPQFHASTFIDRARDTQATVLFGLGAMGMAVLAQPPREDDRSHHVRQAMWVPMVTGVQEVFKERFGIPVISEIYGQSECWPATLSRGVAGPRNHASVGSPIPDIEVRLVDDDDYEVPTGEVGEIVMRANQPNMMFQGYYNNPEATLTTFRNLWHHTGDNGRFDEDGYLFFVDRKKDSLRRRGENVSSIELEQAILKHPSVAAVAAHAVPSELSEDEIKVCIVPTDGLEISMPDLFEFFRSSLPYYAIPRYVEFLDELPFNVALRVQKFKLRERGITETTFDLEALGLVVARDERRS